MREGRCLLISPQDHLIDALSEFVHGSPLKLTHAPTATLPELSVQAHRYTAIIVDGAAQGLDILSGIQALRKQDATLVLIGLPRRYDPTLDVPLRALCDDLLYPPMTVGSLFASLCSRINRRIFAFNPGAVVEFRGRRVDFANQVVSYQGTQRRFTKSNSAVLRFMMSHPGVTIEKRAATIAIWGNHTVDVEEGNNMAVAVCKLRECISDPRENVRRILQTVQGIGFKWATRADEIHVMDPGEPLEARLDLTSRVARTPIAPTAPTIHIQSANWPRPLSKV